MIPKSSGMLQRTFEFGELPTRTHRLVTFDRRAYTPPRQIKNTILFLNGGLAGEYNDALTHDGGAPDTLTGIEILYTGSGPENIAEWLGAGKVEEDTLEIDGIVAGNVDGLEAMKQAVYLVLSIERYKYVIYDWNYGVEIADLFGKPIPFVLPELKRRISEALLMDTRITAVDGFVFETVRGKVLAAFTVHTIFGDIEAEKEVAV